MGGAFFSMRDMTQLASGHTALGREKIIKATEYVEKAPEASQDAGKPDSHYYIVFETERGSKIVSEKVLEEAMWEENPVDLEDRNSLAKVIRTAVTRQACITVQDLKNRRIEVAEECKNMNVRCSTYATCMYVAALGGMREAVQAI